MRKILEKAGKLAAVYRGRDLGALRASKVAAAYSNWTTAARPRCCSNAARGSSTAIAYWRRRRDRARASRAGRSFGRHRERPPDLCRAAYHLGNRHVPLQIGASRLAYLHDHVLDDMVRELGFEVTFAAERFEPEAGAYGHGHAHTSRPPASHSHARDHHDHAHDQDQEHRPSSSRRAHALP